VLISVCLSLSLYKCVCIRSFTCMNVCYPSACELYAHLNHMHHSTIRSPPRTSSSDPFKTPHKPRPFTTSRETTTSVGRSVKSSSVKPSLLESINQTSRPVTLFGVVKDSGAVAAVARAAGNHTPSVRQLRMSVGDTCGAVAQVREPGSVVYVRVCIATECPQI